jgi:hypothetical protein
MITEDIESIRKNGFDVEEIPTGYVFTAYSGKSEGKQGNIRIHKEACEVLQKIGKIEEIQVVRRADSHCNSQSNHRIRLTNQNLEEI